MLLLTPYSSASVKWIKVSKIIMTELRIENQAMMFAFLSRAAIQAKGEEGREAIQAGMIRYGKERGARLAE